VFCDPGVTLRQVDEAAAVRCCSHALMPSGAGDNGKPSLPGGKHETLTDGPDEPRVYQPSTHQPGVKVTSDRGMAIVSPLGSARY
jgi:hypothetical protein